MNKTLIVASLLALSGMSSVAAAADDNWFVRGELGRSSISVNGFGGSSSSDTAGSFRGGYFFNPYFAIEGFYSNYGKRDDGFGDSAKVEGWGFGVVGKKDFGQNNTGFFIDGRVGIAYNKTKLSGFGASVSDNSTKPYVGVGAGWDFNRNFGISLNYDYTQASAFGLSGHVSTWTTGLEARF